MKTRKISVQFFSRLFVSPVGRFFCFESAQIDLFFVDLNGGLKTSIGTNFNSFKSRKIRVIGFSIVPVLRFCGLAQVFPSIIVWFTVFVVDKSKWPSFGNYEPRKPVSEIKVALDSYLAVPSGINVAGFCTSESGATSKIWSVFPNKKPSFLIVLEHGQNIFSSYIHAYFERRCNGGFCHGA